MPKSVLLKKLIKNKLLLIELRLVMEQLQSFGFKTSQINLNVLNDEIRLQSFTSDVSGSHAIDLEVPTNSVKSLVGNNLSLSNLPSEDLIVLMTGNGSKKIASNYGETNSVLN